MDSTRATSLRARHAGPRFADSVVTLPEFLIERERALATQRRLPTAFATELVLGASARAIETVSDVLAEAAGVRIVQYGGLGAFSTVSIRGAPSGQVAVFLDGVPLTSAANGVVNLADLPVTAIERIEVYRGLSPLDLGAASPGGAINLITASRVRAREVRLVRGSYGTWEGRASLGASAGAFQGLIHLGYQGSDGDFVFPDDNGTPFNTFDDSLSTRANNRFDASSVLATASWRPGDAWRLTVREDLFHKAQGVPGIGAAPAHHPRLAFLRSLTHVEVERRAEAWWPRFHVASALQRERTRFRDREAELGLGRHDTDDAMDGEFLAATLGWPWLPAGLSFETTGSLRDERAWLRDAADGFADPPPSRRRSAGAGARIQLQIGAPLLLHAARRWDRIEDELRSVGVGGIAQVKSATRVLDAPQLGTRLAVPMGFELRANWSDALRAPTFAELFGNQGSVIGNPNLVPERSENWDAGVGWKPPLAGRFRANVQWAHFESWARNLVVYVRNSQSSVKAQSIARARTQGEELSLRLDWVGEPQAPRFALTGSFTWQDAVDEGPVPFWNGKRLPQRPARQAYVRLESTVGRLRALADMHSLGDNFLDRYNRYRVANRTLVGASVSFAPFSESVRFTLEGKNLGDNQVSDLGGFPLPGRSVFLSCQVRFAPPATTSEEAP